MILTVFVGSGGTETYMVLYFTMVSVTGNFEINMQVHQAGQV
ncbi:MAG: hypothetical protein Q4G32_00815 [Kocuria sp.]|nr:hypothetical protein [Kocuria sp.]